MPGRWVPGGGRWHEAEARLSNASEPERRVDELDEKVHCACRLARYLRERSLAVQVAMSSCAVSRQGPSPTSIPARRKASAPPPLTCGFGSAHPMTTRRTPLARIASTQGGVRPW
jgi:hypothetical protein